MHLPKINQLVFLLFSPKAALWEAILDRADAGDPKRILDCGGVGTATWYEWRDGAEVTRARVVRLRTAVVSAMATRHKDAERRAALTEVIDRAFAPLLDPELESVWASARRFGMGVNDAKRLLDGHVHAHLPLFPKLYYAAEGTAAGEAGQVVRAIGGAYHAWMRRDGGWLRATLRVRYPLVVVKRGEAVRCEMRVPIQHRREDDPAHWGYDGFVRMRGQRAFWIFEKRQVDRTDFIHFVTGSGIRDAADLWFTGGYLTTGQDPHQSIVAGDLMMHRLSHTDDEAMETALVQDSAVLGAAEAAEVDAAWNALQHRWTGAGPTCLFGKRE